MQFNKYTHTHTHTHTHTRTHKYRHIHIGTQRLSKNGISGLVLVRLPLLTSHKWRELVSSGRLVCRCHGVFFRRYVCFVLLCFRIYSFVEAAALCSIVLRHAGFPIATRVFLFLFLFRLFIRRCHFFGVFFVPFPLSLCMERRRTFGPSEWCFSTL